MKPRSAIVSTPGPRLLAIDAVRGVAAMAVVLYHVPEGLRAAAHIPAFLDAAIAVGDFGVDAFFVLSGFVISMSVADREWNVRFLLRFLARRSIRLDPSYWMAIALELSLAWLGTRFFLDDYVFPTFGGVLAHFFYVQDFAGVPQISAVFWTLCYELQFYLILVAALVVSASVERRTGIPRSGLLSLTLLSLVAYSLLIRAGVVDHPLTGLMIERSYQFGFGIVVWLCAGNRISTTRALLVLVGIIVGRLMAGQLLESLVLGGVGLVCYSASVSPRLNEYADFVPLQFLGRVSYSLYLFHGTVVGRGSTLVLMVAAGSPLAPLVAGLGVVVLLSLSIAVAFVMYLLVEKPTQILSRRVQLG